MTRLLAENIGWKLLSLGIAVVLWATFVGSPELVTSISAPIEYQNMPRNLELSSGLPERVYLEVRGPGARLHSLDLSQTVVVLNLSGVQRGGDHTFTIERHNIELPAGLNLVRIVPSQVRLNFERRLEAEVPIRVQLAHPVPAGYRIRSETVTPKTLKITGPESRVKQVLYAETDPIDLTGAGETVEVRANTFVADPQVRPLSSPSVIVKVTLEKSAGGGAPSDGQATVRN